MARPGAGTSRAAVGQFESQPAAQAAPLFRVPDPYCLLPLSAPSTGHDLKKRRRSHPFPCYCHDKQGKKQNSHDKTQRGGGSARPPPGRGKTSACLMSGDSKEESRTPPRQGVRRKKEGKGTTAFRQKAGSKSSLSLSWGGMKGTEYPRSSGRLRLSRQIRRTGGSQGIKKNPRAHKASREDFF